MTYLVDTNVLLRISDSDHPLCSVCKAALEKLIQRGDTLVGCAQIMIEFWAVATRPVNVNGLGFTPAKADEALRQAEQMLTFLPEPAEIAKRWRELANAQAVLGKQAHDTRLVAFMECHAIANLLTLNGRDFSRFKMISCLSPETVTPSGDGAESS